MPAITSLHVRPDAQGSAKIIVKIDGKTAGECIIDHRVNALHVLRLLCGATDAGSLSFEDDDALERVARFGGDIHIHTTAPRLAISALD